MERPVACGHQHILRHRLLHGTAVYTLGGVTRNQLRTGIYKFEYFYFIFFYFVFFFFRAAVYDLGQAWTELK